MRPFWQTFIHSMDFRKFASIKAWHEAGRRPWSKVLACALSLTFILPALTWAFDPANFTANLPSVLFNNQTVFIPEKIGSVQYAHQGGERLVIHIQDLHCNYEVQMNIARILRRLAGKNGLRLVSVEGTSLPINTTKLSTFPLANIRQEVSDYFVRRGKLSGAEYYAANAEEPVHLEGIENAQLYARNQKSVEFILNDEGQGYCCDLRSLLDELKPGIYHAVLAKYDQRCQAFREGRTTVLQHARFLAKAARKSRLDLSAHSNLTAYLASGQSLFTPRIEADELFWEIDQLDVRLRERLYRNDGERELDSHLRRMDIMEKLLSISAAPRDLETFRQNRRAFRVAAFVKFVREQAADGELELDPELFMLDGYLNAVEDFYAVADERSVEFAKNTLDRMEQHNERLAVLITGGFHTRHLLAELKSRGISYLSVKPRLTKQDLVNPYFSLLQNQSTPLEKLLTQDQRIFALKPYLPKLPDPNRIPDEATELNQKERSFAYLVDLFLQVKTVIHYYLQNKIGQDLQRLVDETLADYPAHSEAVNIRSQNIKVYAKNILSFPVELSNQQDLLAVAWRQKQKSPLKSRDILRRVEFLKENIAFVEPDKVKSVLAKLEKMPRKALADLPLVRLIGLYAALWWTTRMALGLKPRLKALPDRIASAFSTISALAGRGIKGLGRILVEIDWLKQIGRIRFTPPIEILRWELEGTSQYWPDFQFQLPRIFLSEMHSSRDVNTDSSQMQKAGSAGTREQRKEEAVLAAQNELCSQHQIRDNDQKLQIEKLLKKITYLSDWPDYYRVEVLKELGLIIKTIGIEHAEKAREVLEPLFEVLRPLSDKAVDIKLQTKRAETKQRLIELYGQIALPTDSALDSILAFAVMTDRIEKMKKDSYSETEPVEIIENVLSVCEKDKPLAHIAILKEQATTLGEVVIGYRQHIISNAWKWAAYILKNIPAVNIAESPNFNQIQSSISTTLPEGYQDISAVKDWNGFETVMLGVVKQWGQWLNQGIVCEMGEIYHNRSGSGSLFTPARPLNNQYLYSLGRISAWLEAAASIKISSNRKIHSKLTRISEILKKDNWKVLNWSSFPLEFRSKKSNVYLFHFLGLAALAAMLKAGAWQDGNEWQGISWQDPKSLQDLAEFMRESHINLLSGFLGDENKFYIEAIAGKLVNWELYARQMAFWMSLAHVEKLRPPTTGKPDKRREEFPVEEIFGMELNNFDIKDLGPEIFHKTLGMVGDQAGEEYAEKRALGLRNSDLPITEIPNVMLLVALAIAKKALQQQAARQAEPSRESPDERNSVYVIKNGNLLPKGVIGKFFTIEHVGEYPNCIVKNVCLDESKGRLHHGEINNIFQIRFYKGSKNITLEYHKGKVIRAWAGDPYPDPDNDLENPDKTVTLIYVSEQKYALDWIKIYPAAIQNIVFEVEIQDGVEVLVEKEIVGEKYDSETVNKYKHKDKDVYVKNVPLSNMGRLSHGGVPQIFQNKNYRNRSDITLRYNKNGKVVRVWAGDPLPTKVINQKIALPQLMPVMENSTVRNAVAKIKAMARPDSWRSLAEPLIYSRLVAMGFMPVNVEIALRQLRNSLVPRISRETQALLNELHDNNWIDKREVMSAIKSLPELERTDEGILAVIVGRIQRDGRPLFTLVSQKIIIKKGITCFQSKPGFWQVLRQLENEHGLVLNNSAITESLVSRYSPAELKSYFDLAQKYGFTGTLVAQMVRCRRGPGELERIILHLQEQEITVQYKIIEIIGSSLTESEISANFNKEQATKLKSEEAVRGLIKTVKKKRNKAEAAERLAQKRKLNTTIPDLIKKYKDSVNKSLLQKIIERRRPPNELDRLLSSLSGQGISQSIQAKIIQSSSDEQQILKLLGWVNKMPVKQRNGILLRLVRQNANFKDIVQVIKTIRSNHRGLERTAMAELLRDTLSGEARKRIIMSFKTLLDQGAELPKLYREAVQPLQDYMQLRLYLRDMDMESLFTLITLLLEGKMSPQQVAEIKIRILAVAAYDKYRLQKIKDQYGNQDIFSLNVIEHTSEGEVLWQAIGQLFYSFDEKVRREVQELISLWYVPLLSMFYKREEQEGDMAVDILMQVLKSYDIYIELMDGRHKLIIFPKFINVIFTWLRTRVYGFPRKLWKLIKDKDKIEADYRQNGQPVSELEVLKELSSKGYSPPELDSYLAFAAKWRAENQTWILHTNDDEILDHFKKIGTIPRRMHTLACSWLLPKYGGNLHISLLWIGLWALSAGLTAFWFGTWISPDATLHIGSLLGAVCGLGLVVVQMPRLYYFFKLFAKPPPGESWSKEEQQELEKQLLEIEVDMLAKNSLPENYQKATIEVLPLPVSRWSALFRGLTIGQGSEGVISLHPNIMVLPRWARRAVLVHEFYESQGRGHWQATLAEYADLRILVARKTGKSFSAIAANGVKQLADLTLIDMWTAKVKIFQLALIILFTPSLAHGFTKAVLNFDPALKLAEMGLSPDLGTGLSGFYPVIVIAIVLSSLLFTYLISPSRVGTGNVPSEEEMDRQVADCRRDIRSLLPTAGRQLEPANEREIYNLLIQKNHTPGVVEQALQLEYAEQPLQLPEAVEPIFDTLRKQGWINAGPVEQEIRALPRIDRTPDACFNIILHKIKNKYPVDKGKKRDQFFSRSQIKELSVKGIQTFVNGLDIWAYLNQLSDKGYCLNSGAVLSFFVNNYKLEEFNNYVSLFQEGEPKIKGNAAMEILKTHRPLRETRRLCRNLRKTENIRMGSLACILSSRLTFKMIEDHFFNNPDELRKSRRIVSNRINEIMDERQVRESLQIWNKVKKIVNELDAEELLDKTEVVKKINRLMPKGEGEREKISYGRNWEGRIVIKLLEGMENKNSKQRNRKRLTDKQIEHISHRITVDGLQEKQELLRDLYQDPGYAQLAASIIVAILKSQKKASILKLLLVKYANEPELTNILSSRHDLNTIEKLYKKMNDYGISSKGRRFGYSKKNHVRVQEGLKIIGTGFYKNKTSSRLFYEFVRGDICLESILILLEKGIITPENMEEFIQNNVNEKARSLIAKDIRWFYAQNNPLSVAGRKGGSPSRHEESRASIMLWNMHGTKELFQLLSLFLEPLPDQMEIAKIKSIQFVNKTIIGLGIIQAFINRMRDPKERSRLVAERPELVGLYDKLSVLATLRKQSLDIKNINALENKWGIPKDASSEFSKLAKTSSFEYLRVLAGMDEDMQDMDLPEQKALLQGGMQLLANEIRQRDPIYWKNIRTVFSVSRESKLLNDFTEIVRIIPKIQAHPRYGSHEPSVEYFIVELEKQGFSRVNIYRAWQVTQPGQDPMLVELPEFLEEITAGSQRELINCWEDLNKIVKGKKWSKPKDVDFPEVMQYLQELGPNYDSVTIERALARVLPGGAADKRIQLLVNDIDKFVQWNKRDKSAVWAKLKTMPSIDHDEQSMLEELLSHISRPVFDKKQRAAIARQGIDQLRKQKKVLRHAYEPDEVSGKVMSPAMLTAILCSRNKVGNILINRTAYEMLEILSKTGGLNWRQVENLIIGKKPSDIIEFLVKGVKNSPGIFKDEEIHAALPKISLQSIMTNYRNNCANGGLRSMTPKDNVVDAVIKAINNSNRMAAANNLGGFMPSLRQLLVERWGWMSAEMYNNWAWAIEALPLGIVSVALFGATLVASLAGWIDPNLTTAILALWAIRAAWGLFPFGHVFKDGRFTWQGLTRVEKKNVGLSLILAAVNIAFSFWPGVGVWGMLAFGLGSHWLVNRMARRQASGRTEALSPTATGEDKTIPDSVINRSLSEIRSPGLRFLQFFLSPRLQLRPFLRPIQILADLFLPLAKVLALAYLSLARPAARAQGEMQDASRAWRTRELLLPDVFSGRHFNTQEVEFRSLDAIATRTEQVLCGQAFGTYTVEQGRLVIYLPGALVGQAGEGGLRQLLFEACVWSQAMQFHRDLIWDPDLEAALRPAARLSRQWQTGVLRLALLLGVMLPPSAYRAWHGFWMRRDPMQYLQVQIRGKGRAYGLSKILRQPGHPLRQAYVRFAQQPDEAGACDFLEIVLQDLGEQREEILRLRGQGAWQPALAQAEKLQASLQTLGGLIRGNPIFQGRGLGQSPGRAPGQPGADNRIFIPLILQKHWIGAYLDLLEFLGVRVDREELEQWRRRPNRRANSSA